MKRHVKIYLKYFGYCEQDIILSELSGRQAEAIHHIKYRSQGGGDKIENLIALTRKEHAQAHRLEKPFLSEKYLKDKHLIFMDYKNKLSLIK